MYAHWSLEIRFVNAKYNIAGILNCESKFWIENDIYIAYICMLSLHVIYDTFEDMDRKQFSKARSKRYIWDPRLFSGANAL